MLNAIFYMVRTGGSWRLPPNDLPPWRIVYYYFARWRAEGLWQKLRDAARVKSGEKKDPPPRFWIARACAQLTGAECAALDAGKKVMGRKRHLLVDTQGLILKVRVPAANLQDRDGATLLLDQIDEPLGDLQLLWADGGSAGDRLEGWMAERFGARPLRLEIVRRSDALKGFTVLPRRWIVERTFAWLHRFRRLSKDYEFRTDSSEAFILIAASRLLIARLAA